MPWGPRGLSAWDQNGDEIGVGDTVSFEGESGVVVGVYYRSAKDPWVFTRRTLGLSGDLLQWWRASEVLIEEQLT